MRRRYVHVDRGDGIKRADRRNRIRREFLPSMSWVSRLGLSDLCMNTQRKVTGHGDQPKRRNRDTRAERAKKGRAEPIIMT